MRKEAFENLTASIPFLPSLEILDISNNLGAIGAMENLLLALIRHGKLQSVNMTDIPIDMKDVVVLSKLVQPSGSLRELHVGSMPSSIYRSSISLHKNLEDAVLKPSSLIKVGIMTQCSGVESISENITSLAIVSPDQHQQVIGAGDKWSKLLAENTSLKELKLHIAFGKDDLHAIVGSLEVNSSLKRLELSKKLHYHHYTSLMFKELRPRLSFS